MQSNPLAHLGSVTTMYMVSFLITLIFAALMLQIGSPISYISIMMFVFVVSSYVFAGFISGTMSLTEFQKGDSSTRPATVALALASGIVGSGIFVTLAGSFYANGTDALSLFWGWLLGISLMTILFAAKVSRSTGRTLPEVLSRDGKSRGLEALSAICVLGSGTLLAITQLVYLGMIGETFLGIPQLSVIQGVTIALGVFLVISGLQGVTVIRAISYPVMFFIFMVPVMWIALDVSGMPFPQFGFGTGALQPVAEINNEVVNAGLATADEVFDFTRDSANLDTFNYFATLVCIGCAVAAMPHLLQHFRMLDTGANARHSGFLAFGLVFLFLSAVPAIAAYVQLDLYTSILGLQLAELHDDASWVFDLSGGGTLPLIELCGALVANVNDAVSACGSDLEYFISLSDISINPELLSVSQGILHQLPELVTIVMAVGAMLAMMTTLDGIVFSMGLTLSNDGYQRFFRPKSPKSVRLFMIRFFVVLILAGLVLGVIYVQPDAQLSFEFAMAFTAATLFSALLIKLWIPSTPDNIRLYALAASFLFTCLSLWATNLGTDFIVGNGDEFILAIPGITERVSNFGIGIFGLMLSFLIVAASHLAEKYKAIPREEKIENAST